jgi:hypothetical protein
MPLGAGTVLNTRLGNRFPTHLRSHLASIPRALSCRTDFLQAQQACQAIEALAISDKSKISFASTSYYLPLLLGIAFVVLAIALPQCNRHKIPQSLNSPIEAVPLLRSK